MHFASAFYKKIVSDVSPACDRNTVIDDVVSKVSTKRYICSTNYTSVKNTTAIYNSDIFIYAIAAENTQ